METPELKKQGQCSSLGNNNIVPVGAGVLSSMRIEVVNDELIFLKPVSRPVGLVSKYSGNAWHILACKGLWLGGC